MTMAAMGKNCFSDWKAVVQGHYLTGSARLMSFYGRTLFILLVAVRPDGTITAFALSTALPTATFHGNIVRHNVDPRISQGKDPANQDSASIRITLAAGTRTGGIGGLHPVQRTGFQGPGTEPTG